MTDLLYLMNAKTPIQQGGGIGFLFYLTTAAKNHIQEVQELLPNA